MQETLGISRLDLLYRVRITDFHEGAISDLGPQSSQAFGPMKLQTPPQRAVEITPGPLGLQVASSGEIDRLDVEKERRVQLRGDAVLDTLAHSPTGETVEEWIPLGRALSEFLEAVPGAVQRLLDR